MVSGAPHEARWVHSEPRRTLPAPVLERIVHTAFPRSSVAGIQPLAGGWRNTNFKIHLDATRQMIVLRIYEHDASLCQKEVDLIGLVGRTVPVPEVIHAEPRGFKDLPPFALMKYVEGISFHELKRIGDRDGVAQAATSAGETLAAIGRTTFPRPGWLGPGPIVTAAMLEGVDDPMPRFVDLCLESQNLQRRMPADVRDRTRAFVRSRASQLAGLNDARCLVHGDFNRRNLLVRCIAGKWSVAAVLDWEFAISSSPLGDLGSFLRSERASRPVAEPHFSAGYLQGGGSLPRDWRLLARLVDLVALCESLTHNQLPDAVVTELVELIRATFENRAPRLE